MCVAAIARGVIFDEIAREHDACVRDPCHDVPRCVTGAELHELHFSLAKVERHLLCERERRPSEARDALRVTEQARKPAEFRIPILLPALGDKPVGLFVMR